MELFIASREKKDIQNFVGHLRENVGTNKEFMSLCRRALTSKE